MAAASPLDQPYDRLALLPRTLWLPALVCSAGPAANPHDNPQWRRHHRRSAWRICSAGAWRWPMGTLPPPDADFGDAPTPPVMPLRDAAASWACRHLPRRRRWPSSCCARCCGTWTAWPTCSRADARRGHRPDRPEFAPNGPLIQGDWDEALALLQGLGDLTTCAGTNCAASSRREWREAQRISDALAQLPELAALIRRLGRAERAASGRRPCRRSSGRLRRRRRRARSR
jgi:hypothetical protein